MVTLLVAGAAYAMTNKGKPRPALTLGKRNILIVCFGIVVVCGLVVLAGVLIPHTPPSQ
jgi:hypothetical protein